MRHFIIACDGTGQSSARGGYSVSTNVNRLCHALKMDGKYEQIAHYQSGIGTATIGDIYKAYAGGTGAGISDNILDAYQFIMNNYLPGDELSIFGFSRGAYTARVLANFIIRLGILQTRYSWELKNAWKAYQEGKEGEADGETAFDKYVDALNARVMKWDVGKEGVKERTQRTNIKIVGVFDTVGSVVGGTFYDPRLVKAKFNGKEYRIENAFHALALDEYRKPFTPTLWYKTPQTQDTNLEQTWFSGAHTNVGGGYADQICADIALMYMIDRCSPYISFSPSYIHESVINLDHHPENIHSKPRSSLPGGKGLVKEYVRWGTGQIEDSFHNGVHQLGGRKYRSPGEYRTTFETIGKHSVDTCEKIHASVRARWDAAQTDPSIRNEWPMSLHDFVPKQDAVHGWWKWVREETPASWLAWTYATPSIIVEEEEFTIDETKWEWLLSRGWTIVTLGAQQALLSG
ncbi:hypothetical protein K439DRAFT_1659308 [Ramaria rubella]|nr:hypothetical protein K439DRAFT_1659308 [Ramaria rubella]